MYIVKLNATTKTPHLYQDDRDLGEMKKVNDKKSKVGYAYKLPENDLGRQWLKGNLAYDGYEIEEIAERKPSESNWLKYLTTEERERIEELKQVALQRKAEANKPKSEVEKLEARIAKLEAQKAELLKKKGNK